MLPDQREDVISTSKYNIGDLVRVTKRTDPKDKNKFVGKTGQVVKISLREDNIDDPLYTVCFDQTHAGHCFNACKDALCWTEELQLIELPKRVQTE